MAKCDVAWQLGSKIAEFCGRIGFRHYRDRGRINGEQH